MIDFTKMMKTQLDFQKMLYGDRWPLSTKELNFEIPFQVQCISDEAHELLNTVDWKHNHIQTLDPNKEIPFKIQCITNGAHKFLHTTDWKPWRKQEIELSKETQLEIQRKIDGAYKLLHAVEPKPKLREPIDLDEARKEVIDIFTFVLNVFNNLGMTAEDVERMYNEKLKINYDRQKVPKNE